MLPSTLQYSGTFPSAAITVADKIFVSLSVSLAMAEQSAAEAGAAPNANADASKAAVTASVAPVLWHFRIHPETNSDARWFCLDVFISSSWPSFLIPRGSAAY